MKQTIRLVLNEAAFRDLVAGKIVRLANGDVELILSDIGWSRMLIAIDDAASSIAREPRPAK